MIKADRWIGLVLVVFSLYVCVESVRLGLGSYRQPGPGFVSFWSGTILGILSLALIAVAHFGRTGNRDPWHSPGRVLTVFAAMLGFALVLEWLGFVLAAFLLVAVLLKAVENRGWAFSLGVAILVALASYVVFDLWLRAQLPAGVLGD
jgi:putative tricarboxylic transport membrane protein